MNQTELEKLTIELGFKKRDLVESQIKRDEEESKLINLEKALHVTTKKLSKLNFNPAQAKKNTAKKIANQKLPLFMLGSLVGLVLRIAAPSLSFIIDLSVFVLLPVTLLISTISDYQKITKQFRKISKNKNKLTEQVKEQKEKTVHTNKIYNNALNAYNDKNHQIEELVNPQPKKQVFDNHFMGENIHKMIKTKGTKARI